MRTTAHPVTPRDLAARLIAELDTLTAMLDEHQPAILSDIGALAAGSYDTRPLQHAQEAFKERASSLREVCACLSEALRAQMREYDCADEMALASLLHEDDRS